ncbi:MAG: hypothetical protein ACTS2F_23455 [Thainema sp.]
MSTAFLTLIPGAISELFAQATATGQLTWADRYGLMAAILSDSLSDEERCAIDRLLRAVKNQRIIIKDEISALL